MHLNTPLEAALNTKQEYLLALKEMGLFTVRDLLLYFPRSYEILEGHSTLKDVRDGETISITGSFHELRQIPTKNKKLKLIRGLFYDEAGYEAEAVWFNQPYLLRSLPLHSPVRVSAKVQRQYGKVKLQNAKVEPTGGLQVHTSGQVAIYPQHAVITSKWLREKIHPLLPMCDEFEEVLPASILASEGLMSKGEALRELHFPRSPKHMERARDRLGYEELFLLQLKALKAKRDWKSSRTKGSDRARMPLDPEFVKGFFSTLPFTPTGAQKVVIYEILKDMEKPYPMMRLLEGDVGSGKTMVAMMAMLQAVNYGYQVAVMAPTEVLARQHLISITQFAQSYEKVFPKFKTMNIQLLLGALKTAEKKQVLDGLAHGQVDICIGTHALIQEGVRFDKLGLVVVDEQHRFGVKQREILVKQGSPHVLNMTATPIPRTLALVAYGDQDLSVINEMPPGRQVIRTRVVPAHERKTVDLFIDQKLDAGEQLYVICPLVEESDTLELKSATEEYNRLHSVFPKRSIGLLHGRMKSEEKDRVMQSFKNHELDILVATSVIEVGIDVPNATMILIEGADRFGLSQLHQFRGRVGRGQIQSYCFLCTESNSETAMTRLKAMVEHSDGFQLAEIDMRLRGPGEVYGVRQSGLPDLKMANVMNGVLLDRVRKAAEAFLEERTEEGVTRKSGGENSLN